MSEPVGPAISEPSTGDLAAHLTRRLLPWLAVSLAALGAAAARVPFWAAFAPPGERFALAYVLLVQTLAATLCFSYLLADLCSLAAVLATGWPMALLAGALSVTPVSRACAVELAVSLLLIALHVLNRVTRLKWVQPVVNALIATWTIGGAILFYWRAELQIIQARGGSEVSPILNGLMAGPLVAIERIALYGGREPLLQFLLILSALAAMLIGMIIWQRAIARNRAGSKPSSTSPHS